MTRFRAVIEHRGQWARVLPRFSQLSMLCVTALLAGWRGSGDDGGDRAGVALTLAVGLAITG